MYVTVLIPKDFGWRYVAIYNYKWSARFFGESTFSAVDKKCRNWDHYTSAFHLGVNKPHISSSCHISPSLRLSHSLSDLHPAAWDRIRSPSKILVASSRTRHICECILVLSVPKKILILMLEYLSVTCISLWGRL